MVLMQISMTLTMNITEVIACIIEYVRFDWIFDWRGFI